MKATSGDRPAAAAPGEAAQQAPGGQRKKEEFRTWFFLTFVMAPVLAVLIVAGYGFAVWIYQMLAGPPTYH
ncbi:MAG TPA: periplasmic nitrate reductase, NapE protein [Ramlibacter sp.]|uniref:periplasmic nitrate reductase, NapE protein n=1 Tax=Ramlibacter sp. TaxID=1917967 RepID=UPI002D7E5FD1|nr:periplasmic nitrate reductase, NapE protein [Ramlibacter sp.]HET8746695.1 periplasmic nitrate reductase, NapE protein [Ramlibacter sp.]